MGEWSCQGAAHVRFADRLPEIKRTLEGGSTRERRETLRLISRERIALIMDDSYLTAFVACAEDTDVTVRREVASIVGDRWIRFTKSPDRRAIILERDLTGRNGRVRWANRGAA